MRLLWVFLVIVMLPYAAKASCDHPNGEAGVIVFNADHKVMQYCNGDTWVGLWGGGGGSGGGGVPTGAIMAFDLTTCPSGWSEYTPARGRFLRGIDNGAGNDPSGTRAPGNVQADELKSHNHAAGQSGIGNTSGSNWFLRSDVGNTTATSSTGGAETRPKNVAVLYCRKD